MNKAIIGKKLGMSQLFTEDGKFIPVTVVEAGPCPVVQVKTKERDGYEAVQVAFGEIKEKNVNEPLKGHFKKAGVSAKRYLKELKLEGAAQITVGSLILCSVFTVGDHVDVTAKTKGRGFSGVIQRWNSARGPMGHGSGYHRGVGSLSANSDPSRVFKNKHMAGQYGNEQVTIQNLEIAKIDAARNLLFIKGAVPGPKGGMVVVKESIKA
ncbi:MAG TPA: 50S ribosomal protein L3 [Eubacteriales bacterium]|jgi:large subunit ribosomal protein L3|nr:50S ribosomal protein L3 [Clostridia bacterium]HRR89790.1 50S ribosomal protein L3 [Eubacteriales bacterium]HRU83865.1 50S ribosomal protein L3 [Eubacteriales bacterium]